VSDSSGARRSRLSTQPFQLVKRVQRLAGRKLVRHYRVKRGFDLGRACGRDRGLWAGGGKERQVVERAGRSGWAPVVLLEKGQHLAGPADDITGQPGKLCDLNAIRAIGGALLHTMQEDDLVLPFLDVHSDVGDRG